MMELRNITFSYSGSPLLEHLTAAFPPESITAVVGPNGCGKSTLLKLCAGLLRPRHGSVLINGETLSTLSGNQRARQVSILLQQHPTPHLAAEEVVLAGRSPYRRFGHPYRPKDKKIALDAMRQANCAHLFGRELHLLSGGERQRVFLAMALAQQAGILLLDEPTTALDLHAALEFMELARRLQEQEHKTIVIVLHDLDLALRYAHQIVVMDAGRIVFQGTPAQVLSGGVLERVFRVNVFPVDAGGRAAYCFCRTKNNTI